MKIGLVTPYVYPLPGGVTQHVRYLYENLRLRGHDVRIITSSHGLQRASEGDIIRIGKVFSDTANAEVYTASHSPPLLDAVRV
jgi:glycosyltransferase involved in cell wall biosynthesis